MLPHMTSRAEILHQLPHCLSSGEGVGQALGWELKHPGKVRDNFVQGNKRVLIVSDRISAFDKLLGVIPFKGEVLTQISKFWFEQTATMVPNHLLAVPDPQVMIAREASVIPIEVIVRSHLTGSLWRDYRKNKENAYGLNLPEGLEEFSSLGDPIITPSTKAVYGEHDEPISPKEILARGLCTADEWHTLSKMALKLFAAGTAHAKKRGLVLVDTKYEFGRVKSADAKESLIVVDEIHTPDCSRYWYADDLDDRLARGEPPRGLDKEFLRQWLIVRGFSGDGEAPHIPDEVRAQLAERYLELYQVLVGEPLVVHAGPVQTRVVENLRRYQDAPPA